MPHHIPYSNAAADDQLRGEDSPVAHSILLDSANVRKLPNAVSIDGTGCIKRGIKTIGTAPSRSLAFRPNARTPLHVVPRPDTQIVHTPPIGEDVMESNMPIHLRRDSD